MFILYLHRFSWDNQTPEKSAPVKQRAVHHKQLEKAGVGARTEKNLTRGLSGKHRCQFIHLSLRKFVHVKRHREVDGTEYRWLIFTE